MTDSQITYIQGNIKEINQPNFNLNKEGITLFGSITNLKTFLKGYFITRLNEQEFNDQLIKDFSERNFVKAKITEIADQYFIAKSDLQSFYDEALQSNLINEIDKEEFINNSLNFIQKSVSSQHQFGYAKTSLRKILEKQYDFIFSNGFPTNLLNINTGIMTANAGDSAQFLFLARAILAGYNCSNVDVRSSRYDAVVDFNNVLLRLQIKGVSSSNAISFKDRDRGGQGIDHTHITNKGKRITSADCDIYVAVDKEIGICYLIPMHYVDSLEEHEITSINLNTLKQYKENWNIIAEVAETRRI
ncbi:group I intron-associated PD-(D/E)XK endonuclease [Flavobacterium sp. 245]|uniref:group I intron-associated PD-(D/E)XK endonuclease n=1 Tax=Flavobacterium sp. 245 TaxID=2512115 RepID=UPI0010CDFBD8|nr:group I intron-associated PD-(D/E)XK endonuclease [Flavobacterium sp. 245]TDO94919.1 hypothetical protein EV145_1154 [Flavobacterium sp. 245]